MKSKDFMLTFLSEYSDKTEYALQERLKTVPHTIKMYAEKWSGERRQLEEEWLNCWAEYFSNSRSADFLRNVAIRTTVDDVQTDWRHKVPTGKAFELVETVNSYLQSAFFPNKQWFDLYPKQEIKDEEWEKTLDIIKHYILQKLEESKFQDWWDVFTRQMLVCGTSVLALPWSYEAISTYKNSKVQKRGQTHYQPEEITKILKNGFDFEVIDLFDFYIDPASIKPTQGNVIRRIKKRRGDLIRLIETGVYPLGTRDMVNESASYSPNGSSQQYKAEMKWMSGIDETHKHQDELVCMYEFWGNLIVGDVEFVDVCATILGDNLLSIMPNPYWGGYKPFVVGTLINTHDSPYGLSLIQPVLGQLHKLFEIQNHRLDVDELTINPCMLAANDGSLDSQNFYVAPGKIWTVEDTETSIVPLQLPNTTQVAVQDEGLLENRVDKVTGVGAYVGVNGGRHAERVTAEEVQAQRDAGGNRLGRYHKHIENTALIDFLRKAYSFLQQFVLTDEVVRIKQSVQKTFKEQYDYFYVGQEELQHELDIIPVGSDYIIDKEFELQQRLDFYTFVSQNEQLSQYINWLEAIKDLSRRFLKQDWEKFLSIPEMTNALPQQQQTLPQEMPPEMGGMMPQEQPQMKFKDSQAFVDSMMNDPASAMTLTDKAFKANQTL